jgi:glycerophosphoryl diester phosphodiesterase
MSNAIIKQQGAGSIVADNIWEFRLGAGSFVLGALMGALGTLAATTWTGRKARHTKPPTPTGWPVAFAHRGGARVVPEDTVEGFREGLRYGDAVLELDIHATADGHIVVMHDPDVERTTNGRGPVSSMSLAEVQALDAGYRFTLDGGATFPWRGRGVRIPTLDTIYREFPGRPVNIEIKGERSRVEEGLFRVIEAAGAEDRTLVVSNRRAPIRRFRRACHGTVATAASIEEFLAFWVLTLLHANDLYDPPFQAVQPPDRFGFLQVVTPRLVREVHRRGLRIDVWTIDEEADMRRLLSYGVDGIMTDRPDVLARVLGSGSPSA